MYASNRLCSESDYQWYIALKHVQRSKAIATQYTTYVLQTLEHWSFGHKSSFVTTEAVRLLTRTILVITSTNKYDELEVALLKIECDKLSSHTFVRAIFSDASKCSRHRPIYHMPHSSMSDIEVIETNQGEEVLDYRPTVVQRGIKKYWKVKNKIESTSYIKNRLKVVLSILISYSF